MPTTIISTAQSFSDSLGYALGNGLDKIAQRFIESLPATSADGLVDGFEEGSRARVVSSNIPGRNVKKYAKQLNKNAKRRAEVKEPVLLINVNLKPGEKLTPHQLVEMVNDLRQKMGLTNCPFVAVEHREKPHQHLHIIFSRIDFDGQLVVNKNDRLQARTWAREIEAKYNLTPTPQRSPRRLMTGAETKNFERDGTLPSFVKMQNQIDEFCKNPAGKFVELLEEKNVGVIVYFKGGKPFGISFAVPGKKYAGGKLGTEFTWGGLISRGMDYEPARDDKKLAAVSERSKQKFAVQITVAEKPKSGEKSIASLDNSEQNSEQKPEQNFQIVQSSSLEKTSEQPVEISSEERKIQLEKPAGNLTAELSSVELKNTQNNAFKSSSSRAIKQVESVASPSFENLNPAEAVGEITPLKTEGKSPVLNRISSVPSEEQISTERETITAHELTVISEIKNSRQVEKANFKTAEEIVPVSTGKFASVTEINLPVSSISEIEDKIENAYSKPKIRDFAIANRENLINELVNESNEESKRRTGEELSYPQEKNLKSLYRIQDRNKPTFNQTMELNVLQKSFAELLPQPATFFEASVIKLDNSTEAEKSHILRRQIEYVNKNIELKKTQKSESEISILSAEDRKNTSQFELAEYSNRLQKEMEQRGFMPPLAAPSHQAELISKIRIANYLQEQIKESLNEQGIELRPPAQKLLNNRIEGWANELPTAQENRKIEEIFNNGEDRLKPENKLEAVSLIFARADEKERDEISFALASDAGANAEKALTKEINYGEISSQSPLFVEELAGINGELSTAAAMNINSGNQTNQNQTDEHRQRLVDEIVRISRESATKQSIEVSPSAWKNLKAKLTNDAVSREASQSQIKVVTSLQKTIPKEERIDLKLASKLEAIHLILKFSPAVHRDEFVRDSLVNFEEIGGIAERHNFVAPVSEKLPVVKAAEMFRSENTLEKNKSENNVKIIERAISNSPQTNNDEILKPAKPPIAENNSAASISGEVPEIAKGGISRAVSLLPTGLNQLNVDEIRQAEQEFTAQLALHKREIAESRVKDFDSIHENAEKYANLVAHQQKERNNALSMNAVSEIWKKQYKESYRMQWENNRDLRISRRENEIREAISISAKFTANNQSENKEKLNENNTKTETFSKVSADEKVAFLMRSVRQANEEWMQVKDSQAVEPIAPRTERLMQFFIERDRTVAPETETVRTANFIAEMNQSKVPEFTNELDAKVWVMTSLPDTGKQLFLENYIEQVQSNASQMLIDMQTIQINESMQIIHRQSEKLNQEINQASLNQTGLNKMWQSLRQAIDVPANSETIETVRQLQTDNKTSEIITPISELDAVHTTLTKANDSVRETNTNVRIETIRNEVRQEDLEAKAELDAQSIKIKASEARVIKLE
jgi:hypothetical protein